MEVSYERRRRSADQRQKRVTEEEEEFPRFPVDVLKVVNEEQKSIILQTKNIPQTTSHPLQCRDFAKCWLENDCGYFTKNEEYWLQNFHFELVLLEDLNIDIGKIQQNSPPYLFYLNLPI